MKNFDQTIADAKTKAQISCTCAADQRLCFRYTDGTIPLLSKSKISSLFLSSVAVQPSLCQICSETSKTGFLMTGLINILPCSIYVLSIGVTHRRNYNFHYSFVFCFVQLPNKFITKQCILVTAFLITCRMTCLF